MYGSRERYRGRHTTPQACLPEVWRLLSLFTFTQHHGGPTFDIPIPIVIMMCKRKPPFLLTFNVYYITSYYNLIISYLRSLYLIISYRSPTQSLAPNSKTILNLRVPIVSPSWNVTIWSVHNLRAFRITEATGIVREDWKARTGRLPRRF